MKTAKQKRTTGNSTTSANSPDVALLHTKQDVKDAVLLVSIGINAFILSLWVVLQVTAHYDDSLASFFIHR